MFGNNCFAFVNPQIPGIFKHDACRLPRVDPNKISIILIISRHVGYVGVGFTVFYTKIPIRLILHQCTITIIANIVIYGKY